jgi:hypothetical protein
MMVVSFGRTVFKMEESSVSVALEAVIGGQCDQLKVSGLGERIFYFCVASKEVGFHILKLRRFACAQFKCFFHLWGRGGPNWKWEFAQWKKEIEEEWTLVSTSRSLAKKGLASLKVNPKKSAIAKHQFEKRKLVFADKLNYSACQGYSQPSASVQLPKDMFITENSPKISFGTVKEFSFSQEKIVDLSSAEIGRDTQTDLNEIKSRARTC